MSVEENKTIFRRVMDEVFNTGDVDRVDEFVAEDFIEHEAFPGLPEGRDAPKAFLRMLHEGFPDVKISIDDLIAEGDKVVGRGTITGTHRGEFMGMPPTGNKVEVHAIDVVRFRDGLAVEHWGVTDQLAMMQQLGVIPEE
ncbi:MAG: ester cyclase [Acidimicrobiia bacterium]